jgi:MFS family permease
LFRAGEGLVQTVGRLYLIEKPELGGLGLSTEQMSIAYGLAATLAFIGGSILGGYFAAWLGLKRTLFILILMMNVPNLTFWYMSAFHPENIYFIATILSVEMFGYGFGFTGLILYIMQVVAPGKYPTAHYALGTGIMALGLTIFQMISGKIQTILGYEAFFILGVLACGPVLLMAMIAKVPTKEQQKAEPTLVEVTGPVGPETLTLKNAQGSTVQAIKGWSWAGFLIPGILLVAYQVGSGLGWIPGLSVAGVEAFLESSFGIVKNNYLDAGLTLLGAVGSIVMIFIPFVVGAYLNGWKMRSFERKGFTAA